MVRIVPWMDPLTSENLSLEENFLVSSKSKYLITDGIPDFVSKIDDKGQEQVQDSFSFKWHKTDFGQNETQFNDQIKNVYLEMMGLENNDLSIFENKIILDVGIGSGSSARIWASNAKEFHGIDISNAIYRVNNALKNLTNKPFLAKADLNKLPFPDSSFDIIVSNGVLHHTPSTKTALENVITKLKPSGKILFYIYKKKSPIREFSDDFIREKIGPLDNEEAWKSLESITKFAKKLHEQSITINVPEDIDLLGIPKGNYDLQRFFYQYFFKCYWNDKWGFDDSNMINFDWYSPKYAWRQTEEEIQTWCNEFHLDIEFLKEKESGYACLATKSIKC